MRPGFSLGCLLALAALSAAAATGPASATLTLRGQEQTLRLYGTRGGPVALVASGDGGWIHLGPEVAEFLASQGWFVVGFDSKAYLSGFTSKSGALKPDDVPGDFAALVDYAARDGARKPVLIGVSEGAGLAVLAATGDDVKAKVEGLLALGLPDRCELGWRWRDQIIYITKGVPNEPLFSTAAIVAKVAPLPLVAIHSTQDEFVPLDEIRRVMASAGSPHQLWILTASNHRFSDAKPELSRKLLEAVEWIRRSR